MSLQQELALVCKNKSGEIHPFGSTSAIWLNKELEIRKFSFKMVGIPNDLTDFNVN